MPNWCFNSMSVSEPDTDKGKRLIETFVTMAAAERITNEGQKVVGIGMEDWLFDIVVEDSIISFSTRWGTNAEDFVLVATHFDTPFDIEYEESMMGVHGRIVYKDGKYTAIELSNEDLEEITPQDEDDEDNYNYTFRGQVYESFSEPAEILLDEKLKTLL